MGQINDKHPSVSVSVSVSASASTSTSSIVRVPIRVLCLKSCALWVTLSIIIITSKCAYNIFQLAAAGLTFLFYSSTGSCGFILLSGRSAFLAGDGRWVMAMGP